MQAQRVPMILLLLTILLLPCSAAAFLDYRSNDGTFFVRLNGYVKTLAMGLEPSLPGEEDTAEDFTRARLMLEGNSGTHLSWTVHYEHSAVIDQVSELTGGLFAGSLSTGRERFTFLPLDWTIKETGSLFWQHEIDRLNFRLSFPSADIVVGRQAISWGVGRFWTPSDIFVAFSPVEIDREYKTGIDAVTAKMPLGASWQIETVYAASGDNFRYHSSGARLQTNVRDFDLGVLGAKSWTDFVTGAFFDGEIKGAGIRGEFTFTHNNMTPNTLETRTFFRAVSGADYRFANGIYALLEYYYNGFGETNPENYPRLINSKRFTRGEIFNVGRHYIGGTLAYEPHPLLDTSLSGLWNLLDQSFLIGPLAILSLSNEADLRTGAYFPLGPDFVGRRVKSEFGLYARTYYLQLRLYF